MSRAAFFHATTIHICSLVMKKSSSSTRHLLNADETHLATEFVVFASHYMVGKTSIIPTFYDTFNPNMDRAMNE